MGSVNDSPCRYCTPPKRQEGCHANCAAYQSWVVRRKIRKDAEDTVKSRERIADGFRIEGTIKRAKYVKK